MPKKATAEKAINESPTPATESTQAVDLPTEEPSEQGIGGYHSVNTARVLGSLTFYADGPKKGDEVGEATNLQAIDFDEMKEGPEVNGSKLWAQEYPGNRWFPLGATNRPQG